MRRIALFTAITAASLLTACGSSSDDKKDGGKEPIPVLSTDTVYKFDTFVEDETGSSVSYSGQTARHILINDLKSYLKNPSGATKDEILGNVLSKFIYRNDESVLAIERDKTPSSVAVSSISFKVKGKEGEIPSVLQDSYVGGKNLVGKIAGVDGRDKTDAEVKSSHLSHLSNGFVGWPVADSTNFNDKPLAALFDMLNKYSEVAANAASSNSINVALSNDSTGTLTSSYISAEGVDYQQLISKFLLMSVTFSQGTADYLKTDFSGDANNPSKAKSGKTYTNAEHKWDEAFGYLGAARNMPAFNDYELRGAARDEDREEYKYGYFDAADESGVKDGKIDINSELNLGQAVNCAKRDIGAKAQATNYTNDVFYAFYKGRKLINDAKTTLTPDQLKELDGYAKLAAVTWEKCIAATVVHYINVTVKDLNYTDVNGFKDLAKHWSEMKGFALGLQFNPESPVSESVFAEVINAIGTAPVLANGSQNGVAASQDSAQAIADYKAALVEARGKLADAYGAEDPAFKANVKVW